MPFTLAFMGAEEEFLSLSDALLIRCLQDIDIGRLRVFAHVNRRLRKVVKDVLHIRVNENFRQFILPHNIPSFMRILTETESVVGGSIAQAIITPGIFNTNSPSNLNIFVPLGRAVDKWTRYLHEEHGYSIDGVEIYRAGKSVKSVAYLTLKQESYAKVVICESINLSCLTPIFRSRFTSQTNFLTADHLYCLHPHLTPKLKVMEHELSGVPHIQRQRDAPRRLVIERGLQFIGKREQIELCQEDKTCRYLVRFLGMEIQGRGKCLADDVGIMCWGEDQNIEQFIGRRMNWFSVGGECPDKFCETGITPYAQG